MQGEVNVEDVKEMQKIPGSEAFSRFGARPDTFFSL